MRNNYPALATDYVIQTKGNVVALASKRPPSKPLEPETSSLRVRIEVYFPRRVTVFSTVPVSTQARMAKQRLRDQARTIEQRHRDLLDATPKDPPRHGPGHDPRNTTEIYEMALTAWRRQYLCHIRPPRRIA